MDELNGRLKKTLQDQAMESVVFDDPFEHRVLHVLLCPLLWRHRGLSTAATIVVTFTGD